MLLNTEISKVLLIGQSIAIYAWLTTLSPLAVTDTYYSVYLLCGIAGLVCLYMNYKNRKSVFGGGDSHPYSSGCIIFFSAFFSVAVLAANYTLFEPFSVLQNLFDAMLVLTGGYVIARQVLLYLLHRLPLTLSDAPREKTACVFAFVFLSIASIDLMYLFFSAYPGIVTTDSFTTLAQIMGDRAYDNVMPFWHTKTVELFVDLGLAVFRDMNAAVALFHGAQILFIAGCFAYVLMTLYQIGIPWIGLASVYGIYAFMPYNIVYSVTLWKDIPFAGAAVLFITALFRLLMNVGKHRILNYVVFAIGAVGFSLWRTNGWYAFLVTVLILFFILRRSDKMLVIIMSTVLMLCWVLINPVLDCMEVGGTNFVEAFAIPMQQVARVVANGRELTDEQTALLSEIFRMEMVAELYNPQTVDPIKFETFRYYKVPYILENAADYLRAYIEIGLRYPGDYLKAWIEETKGYWNGGYFFWTYTLKMGADTYGIVHSGGDNFIARLYAAVFRYLEKPEILQFTVSIGLYVWGTVVCCLINVLKKRKEFLLTVPLLVLILGLWMGTPVYAEFRYAYPFILALPMIVCVTLYHVKEN